jgi:hypothetical protein
MQRISHDLPGVTQRFAKLADEYENCVQETLEYWRDEKGRSFVQQQLSAVRPAMGQLVSELTKSIELFEQIAKRVQDPDQPGA